MLREDLKAEFDSLRPGATTEAGSSRRTAIKLALGVGYAASVMPIQAQTAIKTSADGLRAGATTIEVNGFKVPVYTAAPAGKTGLPVVLVIQEIFGVHEYIADTARRFAKAGYLAIAPDLFARQGDATKYTDIPKLMAEIVSKVPDAQVIGDLDACVKWAAANGGDTNKVAITGFCWGGRITWLYAAQANVKAGVAWYGRLVGAPSELTPKHPVDIAASLKAPVLGLYGFKDTGITQESVAQMRAALAAASATNPNAKASEIVVFRDAGHAFHADYRPSYVKEVADDGWQRALDWFKKNGVA
ncbi:dienelactone hydrolase family protein [Variovorax sp. HJSM1_2]|uniref:dienelactone hydrolase family protein n=1 Tax=Variovorax sp. HJSM1_2 TaxID=3366263 RepID=UPI003BC09D05